MSLVVLVCISAVTSYTHTHTHTHTCTVHIGTHYYVIILYRFYSGRTMREQPQKGEDDDDNMSLRL